MNCLRKNLIIKNENPSIRTIVKNIKINFDDAIIKKPIQNYNEQMTLSNNGDLYCEIKLKPKECQSSENFYKKQDIKSSDTLRKIYYSRLINKKLWNPSRVKKKQNTLIIFDWDDTLLPTTFLTPNGYYNDKMVLNHSENEQFKLIEKSVYKVLTMALEKGETYIITNAAPGWVEYTANKYFPSILRVLKNIKVLSARGGYEKQYPKDYRQWKIQTFLEMKKEFESNLITNILCMGDSMNEMIAGHLLSSKFNKAYIKTIKFRESPKLKILYKQLLMIVEKFNEIYLTLKSLAISIDKKSEKV